MVTAGIIMPDEVPVVVLFDAKVEVLVVRHMHPIHIEIIESMELPGYDYARSLCIFQDIFHFLVAEIPPRTEVNNACLFTRNPQQPECDDIG